MSNSQSQEKETYGVSWGACESWAAIECTNSGTKHVGALSAWQKWYATTLEAKFFKHDLLWILDDRKTCPLIEAEGAVDGT